MQSQCAAPDAVFQSPDAGAEYVEPPRAAVIEVVERHKGPRRGFTGPDSILVPNRVRINGVLLYARYDDPVVVDEVRIDGGMQSPFTVQVRLLARALKVGGEPAYDVDAESPGGGGQRGAVVEIPGVDHLVPGEDLTLPWVLLNGHRLYVAGQIIVGALVTRSLIQDAATVTLTLLCRQFTVDDEPEDEPAADTSA